MDTVFGLWESHWEDDLLGLSQWHFTEKIFASYEAAEAHAIKAQLTAYDIREYLVRE